jgi:CRISPR-associated protein Cas6
MHIDVVFPVRGESLPTDHAYLLYSALSHAVQGFHDPAIGLRFAPINGLQNEKGLIRVFEKSRLRVRLLDEQFAKLMPLAGQTLRIGENHSIRLGMPTVFPLIPAPLLVARMVTYKNTMEPGPFLAVTRQRLDAMGIAAEPGIPIAQTGSRAGEPRRQVVRISGKHVIGFSLQVEGLTAEESVRLQEEGLGGRCRIGCGFFMPYRPRNS